MNPLKACYTVLATTLYKALSISSYQIKQMSYSISKQVHLM